MTRYCYVSVKPKQWLFRKNAGASEPQCTPFGSEVISSRLLRSLQLTLMSKRTICRSYTVERSYKSLRGRSVEYMSHTHEHGIAT